MSQRILHVRALVTVLRWQRLAVLLWIPAAASLAGCGHPAAPAATAPTVPTTPARVRGLAITRGADPAPALSVSPHFRRMKYREAFPEPRAFWRLPLPVDTRRCRQAAEACRRLQPLLLWGPEQWRQTRADVARGLEYHVFDVPEAFDATPIVFVVNTRDHTFEGYFYLGAWE